MSLRSLILVCLLAWQLPAAPTNVRILPLGTVPPSSSGNAYFTALTQRADLWKAYSLRDQAQLDLYKASRSLPPNVTYDPTHDPHPLKQDAAKVVIPEYVAASVSLVAAIDATQTTVAFTGNVDIRFSLKIDNEVLYAVTGGTTITVTRGYAGTVAAPHAASALVFKGTNSLPNQVWLPMGTQDGHRYLTTWDAWFDERCLPINSGLVNWKTFQFRKLPSATIWFEVRTRFDGGSTPWQLTLSPQTDVAAVDVRGYSNPVGPNVTRQEPLSPMLGTFRVVKQTWTRYWMLIDQRAGDWDLVSLWVADPTHDAVQIFDRLQVEADTGIHSFQLEFNTSTYTLKPGRGPLTVYVRNVVMLRDVADVGPIMVKP